jgi:hypothetical protein
MTRFDARAWSVRGIGLAFMLGACNQVLGIEPASIDPRLTAAGRAGASQAAAGTGGSLGEMPGSGGSSGTDGALPASGGTAGEEHAASGGSTSAEAGDGGDMKPANGSGGSAAGARGGSTSSGGSATGSGGSSKGSGGSSGTRPGDGASGEGGDSGDKSGSTDPCDEYCDLMDANCTGNDEQYRDQEQCLKICHLLPQGSAGATDDDSITCRLKYAEKMRYAAGAELSTYCQQAGPSGDASCGTVCQAYCVLMGEVCTPDVAGTYHFANDTDCMNTCQGLPAATVPYSFTNPLVSDGNHALCRLFHVTSAAMADADEHCEHAMGVTLCEATP